MTKLIKQSLATCAAFIWLASCDAQMNHAKTVSVKIYGNCGMCKKNIETAGNIHNIVNVTWDQVSKMASITYDSTKSNPDEILQRIANAGYDSDSFSAPDEIYNNLHRCCQYKRPGKIKLKSE